MPAPQGYTVATMKDFVGQDFGTSKPLEIDQIRINTFADVTGDHQWIHVNPDMAKKHSPFGGTVAHGFLTLSLMAASIQEIGIVPSDAKGVINYGIDKVRFLTPVLVDSKVSTSYKLTGVEPKGEGQQIIRVEATVSIEGMPKPALIGDVLAMVIG